MGTTTPGILASIAILVAVFVISTIKTIQRKYHKWSWLGMKDAACESVRPLIVTACVTALVWIVVFSVFVAKGVYEDHTITSLVSRAIKLEGVF